MGRVCVTCGWTLRSDGRCPIEVGMSRADRPDDPWKDVPPPEPKSWPPLPDEPPF